MNFVPLYLVAKKILPGFIADTMFIRCFSFFYIPLLNHIKPSVVELSDSKCVIRVPFRRRNTNHVGSMYFGAMTIGAEAAAGLLAMHRILVDKKPVTMVFRDVEGQFLKAARGEAHFTCVEGAALLQALEECIKTGQRMDVPVVVTATVPSKTQKQVVARFVLTLSLKKHEV